MALSKIIESKRLWIYGIGVIGKRICQVFDYFKIDIDGILVSSMKGNIDSYMGIKVKEFDPSEFGKDDLIIVTAVGKSQIEIVNNIADNNVAYVVWTPSLLRDLWKTCRYTFESRIKGEKKLCIVLSGYKEYLWENVHRRLQEDIPNDVEVCLCSAGKYVSELSAIAEKNGWSYLCTDANSVSLIQNVSISLFPDAEWIYKMDEDMFITKNTFVNMLNTAKDVIDSGIYELGLCSPLIPVNAIGYRYVLKKYKKLKSYEDKFGKAIVGGCSHREIETNPETAKFMWGEGGLPQIDKLSVDMQKKHKYQVCTTRLSIGFILFQRELWEKMQGFIVHGNMDLGVDEEDINAYCINNSRIMAISMNSVVGHFGFGKQTNEMKTYYENHKDRF